AKQFLERMEKPNVDRIEGVSPAVAIEQKNPVKTSRSTVGTATEVYDYLRLLWARVGRTYCPQCGRWIRPDSPTTAVDRVLELEPGTRIIVAFAPRRAAKVSHTRLVESLRALGFVRVLADGKEVDLGAPGAENARKLGVNLASCAEVLVAVDRLIVRPDERDRLADSLGTAFVEGEGEAVVLVTSTRAAKGDSAAERLENTRLRVVDRLQFTERFRCPEHAEVEFADPRPQLFSFNNPYGSCPTCTGFGATLEYDLDLIVPDPQRTLAHGAIDPWTKPRYTRERERLRRFANEQGVSVDAPWKDLPERFRAAVLHGTKGFRGVIPFLKSRERKRYKQYIRVFLRQYQRPVVCPTCSGGRLRAEACNVKVAGRTIAYVSELPLEALQRWFTDLDLPEWERLIAATILREIEARLAFLVDIGLGYLTLSRQTRTLSGGEAQRINLANALGAGLVDTLYVLDEPTVGLHPRDTRAMLQLLHRLVEAGSSVLVVEHDMMSLREADHIVELGPGSGEHGGQVVFQGSPSELERADTITGRYFSGREGIPVTERRPVNRGRVVLEGARLHNLRGVDVEIPLAALTVVTGVSGSGKSTLVHDVLYHALKRATGEDVTAKLHLGEAVGAYRKLDGAARLEGVVLVDQSPIGRTPRSNPATYIGAWDEVRRIFAEQPTARKRGYKASRFSFNVDGGRCEACKGAGAVEVEMIFMADVFVPCDVCGGARFKPETLEVSIKGLNVRQVLDLTADEAMRFFIRHDRLGQMLWQLQQVGLGYLRLGQPAPTLSGGEAQRLKIARELVEGGRRPGRKLYLLDEPTTGLAADDVRKLLKVLARLLDLGNTVLVIEHNLDVIKSADWVIDLGPGAGDAGGRVVAMGRPEDVAAVPESVTGRCLRDVLGRVGTASAVG
ncbi:MAG: excinuclease ABC subunit UvrA, partial [Gemmatimonadetes bacterium]|nr:excinuclease ABC subunit UvrA [Gemmatimonadota bacterium]